MNTLKNPSCIIHMLSLIDLWLRFRIDSMRNILSLSSWYTLCIILYSYRYPRWTRRWLRCWRTSQIACGKRSTHWTRTTPGQWSSPNSKWVLSYIPKCSVPTPPRALTNRLSGNSPPSVYLYRASNTVSVGKSSAAGRPLPHTVYLCTYTAWFIHWIEFQ